MVVPVNRLASVYIRQAGAASFIIPVLKSFYSHICIKFECMMLIND